MFESQSYILYTKRANRAIYKSIYKCAKRIFITLYKIMLFHAHEGLQHIFKRFGLVEIQLPAHAMTHNVHTCSCDAHQVDNLVGGLSQSYQHAQNLLTAGHTRSHLAQRIDELRIHARKAIAESRFTVLSQSFRSERGETLEHILIAVELFDALLHKLTIMIHLMQVVNERVDLLPCHYALDSIDASLHENPRHTESEQNE